MMMLKMMMKIIRISKYKIIKKHRKNGDFSKKFKTKFKILQEIKSLKMKIQTIFYNSLKNN